MTGYLMIKCGSCGAPNKIRSLREVPLCVECTLSISLYEKPEMAMLLGLLGDVDRRFLRVTANEVRTDQGLHDLPQVLGGERVEVTE